MPCFESDYLRTQLAAKDAEIMALKQERDYLYDGLNKILHPNGDGPERPSGCDLLSFLKFDLKKIKHERDCYRMVCVGLEIQNLNELPNSGADVAHALGCHMADAFKRRTNDIIKMSEELEALDNICKLQEKILIKLGANSELQSK